MDLKNLFQVMVIAVIQVVPDLIDIGIQVSNSVSTINEMDIEIFDPSKKPFEQENTTTAPYIAPTTTTISTTTTTG